MHEILDLLDKKQYNQEEIRANYDFLVGKYGEIELGGSLQVTFVDIGHAVFSGLMKTFATLCVVCLGISIIFGKIVLPLLEKSYKNRNDEMVDIASLKSADQIDKIVKAKKQKSQDKEYF